MYFSPVYLSALIVEPLRYFFKNYAGPNLVWSYDDKETMIEINTINNFNKIPIQLKPRILVSRGEYSIAPTGLADNLVQSAPKQTMSPFGNGTKNQTKMVLISGIAQIMVEARNEGTAELLVELVQHFLSWTGPMIASTNGFKNFGQNIRVSTCNPTRDDTEIFSCTFNVPWVREEQWTVTGRDDISLKNFLMNLSVQVGAN